MSFTWSRAWLGRPLWEMEPSDADAYFGKVLRGSREGGSVFNRWEGVSFDRC
jgi:hypothetical protein